MSVATRSRIARATPEQSRVIRESASLRAAEWAVAVAIIGLVALEASRGFHQIRPLIPELFAWLAVVVVSDLVPVPLWGSFSLALSLPILLAAGFLFPPFIAGILALLGSNDPREFRHEITLAHGLYNRTQIALSAMTASIVFRGLGGDLNSWPAVVPLALIAVAADMVVNLSLVVAVSKLYNPRVIRDVLKDFYGGEPAGFLTSYVCFGLVALLLSLVYRAAGAWGLAVFMVPVLLARQVFVQSRSLRDMAEALGDKTRMLLDVSQRIADERREERLMIAGGLHDEVLPPLYKVHLMGQVIRQDLATGQLLALEDDVPDLLRATQNANDAMRILIRDLRHSPLGPGGLADALRLLVRHVQSETTINLHLEIQAVGGPPVVQLLAYQVAREAVKNAINHSRASNVWIEVMRDSTDMRLVIADDGHGFDPSAVDTSRHFGMQLMRERVELAGGVFHVSSQGEAGTQIVARFPAETSTATA